MKRVKAACLLQTLHFQLKDDVEHDLAVKAVEAEVAHYKKQLEFKRVAYRIDEESVQPDGSILLRVRKQYNSSDVGNYLD